MNYIGKYRLKIYELLYNKPICNYAENADGKKQFNVLILGNGWAGNEMFKASFWAGQSINSKLNITVASKNASAYRDMVMSEAENAVLPALRKFSQDKEYANISFIEFDLDDENTSWNALHFDSVKYNYIVIALGDEELNYLAGSELVSQLSIAKECTDTKYNGNIIINIFDEFSNQISKAEQSGLIADAAKNGIEINFFGNEIAIDQNELERLAKNINFAYEQKYNQRIGKKAADEKFFASRDKEFFDIPTEYVSGDIGIIENFIGGGYNADSSYANAVHIPYKVAICAEYDSSMEPLQVLSKAIAEKNELYRKLVALEHRRWNAYMVMRGYRAPTHEEEKKYLYKKVGDRYNTHKDDEIRLHICLCDCDEYDMDALSNFVTTYEDWQTNGCSDAYPTELSRASLRAYELAATASKYLDESKLMKYFSDNSGIYDYVIFSIKKMLNDEDNSVALYERELEYLQGNFNITKFAYDRLKELDKVLIPLKARNQKMNFISLDAQLIEMLPFIIWYGVSKKVTIVISGGSAYEDIIAPTLLTAEQAIFVTKECCAEYENIIKKYFLKRGGNTTPSFLNRNISSVMSIKECVSVLIAKYGMVNVTVCCARNTSTEALVAVGIVQEELDNKLNVVRTDCKNGLIPISGEKFLGVGLNNKSLTTDEFIELAGGRIENEYDVLYDTSKYDSLHNLFDTYSKIKFATVTGKVRSVWQQVSQCLAKECDKAKNNCATASNFKVNINKNSFVCASVKFYTCVDEFIEKLNEGGYIIDLEKLPNNAFTFRFADQSTMNLFSKQGNVFELMIYKKTRHSGIFDDVKTGVNFYWDAYDKTKFVSNEIDVVAMMGMLPIFISCKNVESSEENSRFKTRNEWIYEIYTITSKLNCIGAMAVSYDATENDEKARIDRAEQMGISFIGAETICDDQKFNSSLKKISEGSVYRYKMHGGAL